MTVEEDALSSLASGKFTPPSNVVRYLRGREDRKQRVQRFKPFKI